MAEMGHKECDTGSQPQEKLLTLVTRLNVLSTVALSTTIIKKLLGICAVLICPEECWIHYVFYITGDIDAFINIFCILCSFSGNRKYYEMGWICLHKLVLKKCVGKVIERRISVIPKKNETNTEIVYNDQ